jgi:integrase/recombinase XerD
VLIPKVIAARLFAARGDAPSSAPVFPSVRRPGSRLTDRAVNFIVKEAAERAGVNPAASIHWLRHAHASHAIDNGAPKGDLDLAQDALCDLARCLLERWPAERLSRPP